MQEILNDQAQMIQAQMPMAPKVPQADFAGVIEASPALSNTSTFFFSRKFRRTSIASAHRFCHVLISELPILQLLRKLSSRDMDYVMSTLEAKLNISTIDPTVDRNVVD